jgi:hypothetical protein
LRAILVQWRLRAIKSPPSPPSAAEKKNLLSSRGMATIDDLATLIAQHRATLERAFNSELVKLRHHIVIAPSIRRYA